MNNWLNLEGKVVIVTGGACGIGYAVVEEFLADGAKVVVCDINANAPEFKGATSMRDSPEEIISSTMITSLPVRSRPRYSCASMGLRPFTTTA